MKRIHTAKARILRDKQTAAEQLLWSRLRNRQLGGWKFRRQHGIGPYILDFVCLEAGLVVEVDGGQHAAQHAYDESRSEFLRSQGLTVLRFWNNEVLEQTEAVLERVCAILASPSPLPSPRRGEGGIVKKRSPGSGDIEHAERRFPGRQERVA